jgi:hypothetical protein
MSMSASPEVLAEPLSGPFKDDDTNGTMVKTLARGLGRH